MKELASAFCLLFCAAIASSQAPATSSLFRVGAIAAENGMFAVENEWITAYPNGSVSVEFGSGSRSEVSPTPASPTRRA